MIPTNGVISEVWHANKWRQDLDRHCLSPMYDAGNERHYFIDEPAMLESGVTVIPLRWLEDEEGEVWFDAWKVDVADKTVSFNNQCQFEIQHAYRTPIENFHHKRRQGGDVSHVKVKVQHAGSH